MAEGNGEPKMVPEKDLLAVKASAERKLEKVKADLQAKVDAAEQELYSEKKSRLTADSSVSKIEKELADAKKASEDVDKLKADLALAEKSGKESSDAVLDLTRRSILSGYEIEEEKLEGKSLEQLKQYEEVLADAGKKREPGQKFDGGSGGGVSTEGKSGMTLIKEGLAEKDKSK